MGLPRVYPAVYHAFIGGARPTCSAVHAAQDSVGFAPGLGCMGVPCGRPAVEHPVVAGAPPSLLHPSNVVHVVALGLSV